MLESVTLLRKIVLMEPGRHIIFTLPDPLTSVNIHANVGRVVEPDGYITDFICTPAPDCTLIFAICFWT